MGLFESLMELIGGIFDAFPNMEKGKETRGFKILVIGVFLLIGALLAIGVAIALGWA